MATMTNSFDMVVSEKELVAGKNQYVAKGKVAIYYPTLADLNIPNAQIKGKSDDGFPIYEDDLHTLVQDAVIAMVKSNARNKLTVSNGVVGLKEGASLPTTTEQLLESGGNSGAALQAIRDFLAAAKAWLATTGKSLPIQQQVYEFFKQPATISLIEDDKKRDRVRAYMTDFAATLSAEKLTAWNKRLTAIDEACSTVSALDDAEF